MYYVWTFARNFFFHLEMNPNEMFGHPIDFHFRDHHLIENIYFTFIETML